MKTLVAFGGVALLAGMACGLVAGQRLDLAFAGWIVSLANGLIGWMIDRKAVTLKGERAVLASLAAHAVRALGLLLLIVAVWMRFGADSKAFVSATLAGYFVILFCEIVRLARSSG